MEKLKFETMDELIKAMYESACEGEVTTVVAHEELSVALTKALLADNKDLKIEIMDIDTFDYDSVYHVALYYIEEEDAFTLNVEKGVDEEIGRIYATDGYVLFADDVCNNIIEGMVSNKYADFYYDVFAFGKEDKMEETVYVYRDTKGNATGFVKSWTNSEGVSSYSFRSNNANKIREIAAELGIDI